ncbi:acyl-CoA desaturase [Maricaulis sp. D1M11]|uniref:acyl-CoA desaturase n=1 Tax=Maricaulis sp. D1M11 TaxID=3076117 RepID=UPI0039B6D823
MTIESRIRARSEAILKSWQTLNWASVFSAIIYPALGAVVLLSALVLGLALDGLTLRWWYAPIGVAAMGLSIFLCNMGIGPLHRIWQHRAGEIKWPGQVIVMFNCILAMQGSLKDWVNYHSQHHRFADQAGDPHNPNESKFWAWIGWIMWRDENDLARPMPMWLKENKVVLFGDRYHISLSLVLHFLVPGVIYAIVALSGGSLILTAIIHASVVIGRGIQFHATTLGVNVFGHMKTPLWFDYLLAFLTGGEALHDHHHEFPKSALHLPKKGFFNRLVDYNGTALLVMKRLGWAKNLQIAPQFA